MEVVGSILGLSMEGGGLRVNEWVMTPPSIAELIGAGIRMSRQADDGTRFVRLMIAKG